MKGVTVAAPTTFQADMKLEAKDRKHPSLVCVATVKEVSSRGQLLIHFDGWGPEYDYWCEPTTTDIHPAGWCKNNQHVLQPPHSKKYLIINQKHCFQGLIREVKGGRALQGMFPLPKERKWNTPQILLALILISMGFLKCRLVCLGAY